MNSIMEVLINVEKGNISTEKAIKLIENLDIQKHTPDKKASKIKITIVDGGDKKSIRIPAIPFWIITSLAKAGIKLSSWIGKFSDHIDDDTKKYLDILEDLDLKDLIDVFRSHGPFDMVDIIDEENGDVVKITIL